MRLSAPASAAAPCRTRHEAPCRHFAIISRPVVVAAARESGRAAAAAAAASPARSSAPPVAAPADSAAAYLETCAAPLNAAALRMYAFHERVFDQLLATPRLDERLRCSSELRWAGESVRAAVRDAAAVAWQGSRSASPAAAAEAGAVEEDVAGAASSSSGCPSDDEGCEVDWDVLLPGGGGDGASGNGDGAVADALASRSVSPGAAADTASAAAAVALEAATGELFDVAAARLFLQRLLYKVNRLNHFWYDDLRNYENERSAWLAALRDDIERSWQAWEERELLASLRLDSLAALQAMSPQQLKDELQQRFTRDVDPPLSEPQRFIAQSMSPQGYAHLLAIGSLDGLTEASRQSRVCAGAANEVAVTIFRVLMEEYGSGRLSRKHSTFYRTMMSELGLDTREEAYLDLVPWQGLAAANQNFLLTERRRWYVRYAGALSFFEINGPSVYKVYLNAARRCGLSEAACGYWELHIREDERHGRQMLAEVALPLVDMYPADAWELLLGWEQDRFLGARAGAALVAHLRTAEELQKQLQGAMAAAADDG